MHKHGTKTTPAFLLLMEKQLGHYFQVWSPYYQVAQCNQKTPIPISSRIECKEISAKKAKKSSREATDLIIFAYN